jgi:GcrA cell cycle regulator
MTYPNGVSEFWQAHDARLIELWNVTPKLSVVEIGARLGVTKNAVVGRAHRLCARGLIEARPSPIRPPRDPNAPPRERRPRTRKPRQVSAMLPPLPSGMATPPAVSRSLGTINHRAGIVLPSKAPKPEPYRMGKVILCCWPITKDRPHRFCDEPSARGLPYCPDHCQLAYVANPTKRADYVETERLARKMGL